MCYGFEVTLGTILVLGSYNRELSGVWGAIFKGMLLSRGRYYSVSAEIVYPLLFLEVSCEIVLVAGCCIVVSQANRYMHSDTCLYFID